MRPLSPTQSDSASDTGTSGRPRSASGARRWSSCGTPEAQRPFAIGTQVVRRAGSRLALLAAGEESPRAHDRFDIAESRGRLCGQAGQSLALAGRDRREVVLPRDVTQAAGRRRAERHDPPAELAITPHRHDRATHPANGIVAALCRSWRDRTGQSEPRATHLATSSVIVRSCWRSSRSITPAGPSGCCED